MSLRRKSTVQPTTNLTRKLLVADWDGTLRPGFMLQDWLHYLADENAIDLQCATQFDDLLSAYEAKSLDYQGFASAVLALYARSLSGSSVTKIQDYARDFVTKDMPNLFEFVPKLIEFAANKGIRVAVVSGGPAVVLREYGTRLGIDHIWGVDVHSKAGLYGNEVVRDTSGPDGKAWVVEQLKQQGFVILIALGDTIADKPLLDAAEFAYAISEEDEDKSSRLLREIAPIIPPVKVMDELEGVV